SELDAASLAQLERGRRVVEVLKQGQYSPVKVEEQVMVIFAVTEGHMDSIPVDKIEDFEAGLLDFVRTRHPELLEQIASTGELPEVAALVAAISAFTETFEE
ncbi:MAG: F0F1 ATP synthase subunit alpha, partial [Acidimicrobiia bacterium]|nr:F0F1 ATP synthase subunit alpha [Acidimicrobiia bacterium]